MQQLGAYQILRELGRGGMGVVYQARHLKTGELVAIKAFELVEVTDQALRAKERFVREGQILQSLSHPAIVSVKEVASQANLSFIVMEYLVGQDLQQKLNSEGPFDWQTIAPWLIECASALEHIHALGIVHRDIKPANIFLTEDQQIKLIDFGLVKAQNLPKLSQTGQFLGTPEFTAPEQLAGTNAVLTPSADIYSLALSLLALASGASPFRRDSLQATARAVLNGIDKSELQILDTLPAELANILRQSLCIDPKQRPASARDLSHSFQRAMVLENRISTVSRLTPLFTTFLLILSVALLGLFVTQKSQDHVLEIDKLKRKQHEVIELYKASKITAEDLQQQNSELLKKLKRTETKLTQLRSTVESSSQHDKVANYITQLEAWTEELKLKIEQKAQFSEIRNSSEAIKSGLNSLLLTQSLAKFPSAIQYRLLKLSAQLIRAFYSEYDHSAMDLAQAIYLAQHFLDRLSYNDLSKEGQRTYTQMLFRMVELCVLSKAKLRPIYLQQLQQHVLSRPGNDWKSFPEGVTSSYNCLFLQTQQLSDPNSRQLQQLFIDVKAQPTNRPLNRGLVRLLSRAAQGGSLKQNTRLKFLRKLKELVEISKINKFSCPALVFARSLLLMHSLSFDNTLNLSQFDELQVLCKSQANQFFQQVTVLEFLLKTLHSKRFVGAIHDTSFLRNLFFETFSFSLAATESPVIARRLKSIRDMTLLHLSNGSDYLLMLDFLNCVLRTTLKSGEKRLYLALRDVYEFMQAPMLNSTQFTTHAESLTILAEISSPLVQGSLAWTVRLAQFRLTHYRMFKTLREKGQFSQAKFNEQLEERLNELKTYIKGNGRSLGRHATLKRLEAQLLIIEAYAMTKDTAKTQLHLRLFNTLRPQVPNSNPAAISRLNRQAHWFASPGFQESLPK